MIVNQEITIKGKSLKYTIFERKLETPYVSNSGVEINSVILAPFIYSYRTSTKQSNFKFEVKAGIWASKEIFERWLSGDTDRTEPIDTYDMVFTSNGIDVQVDETTTVNILNLEDAISWFDVKPTHIGGFEITDIGYSVSGILTLPDPNTNLPLSTYWE